MNTVDPLGLFCEIIFSEPVPGGDPINEYITATKDGYLNAAVKKFSIDLLLSFFSGKYSIPNIGIYNYTEITITWQTFKLFVQYTEVCYDDCTGEEISRKLLRPGQINKTIDVAVDIKNVKLSF